MKKIIRIIAVSAFFIAFHEAAVCSAAEKPLPYAAVVIIPDKVPLGAISVPEPAAPGTQVTQNARAVIDYSNAKDGYIMVKCIGKASKELRVSVKSPRGETYTYVLNSSGNYDVFPLSEGDGRYQTTVYENLNGTKYSALLSATFQVTLASEFAPFLRPNQYVSYTSKSTAVTKASEITGSTKGVVENIAVVYGYVTKNIVYDKELAATVQKGYLSDIDAVIKKGKGICFDYAAVMTAMLRSQQIPAKLVIGYCGKAYHAWINVYSSETGWIEKAVYFDGSSWKLMDPTYAASKKSTDEKGYSAKFMY